MSGTIVQTAWRAMTLESPPIESLDSGGRDYHRCNVVSSIARSTGAAKT